MLVLCYHNGALGHTVSALMDCCTEEGSHQFPSFVPGKHLHHHAPKSSFYCVRHPYVDLVKEKQNGNKIISSSSYSVAGRLLILLMGLKKYAKAVPEFNAPIVYKQHGASIQEQLEVLADLLLGKVLSNEGWYTDVDVTLDVTNFWTSPANVSLFLTNCGLHPIDSNVEDFCQMVATSNQQYVDTVEKCVKISNDILDGKDYKIDVSFFEAAMTHVLVTTNLNKTRVYELPRPLACFPTSTMDYIKIFKD